MKPKPSLRSFLALAGSSLLAMSSAHALTYYWDGTSATWNDVANWSTDATGTTDPGALPLVSDDLIFNITGANTAQNITLDAAQAAKSLTFNTTGATHIRANSSGTDARILTLGSGGITLAVGAGAVTIGESPATYGAVNITLGAAQTWSNSSSSLLSVTGNVDNGGNLLTIGSSGTTGPMSIGGVISGAGGITVTSKTRLVLSGANEFTGAITVNGFTDTGTIAFTSIADFGVASALGKAASGSISLGNGGSEGRLEYIGTSNSESDRTISIKGTSTTAGQIYNNGTGTLTFDATTFNTVNGSGVRYLVLGGSNTGSNEIKGTIIDNTGGALNLNKTGTGTWVLGGNNSYTGVTTISGGTLRVSTLADAGSDSNLGAFAAAGAGGISLSGGTLQYTGASGVSVNRGFTLAATSTVDVNPASTALTLGASSLGGSTLNVTGGSGSSLALGALTLTGGATLNSNVNLTVASVTGTARNLVLTGTSSGSIVTGAIATTSGTLSKTNTGTWILRGNNSFTGTTGISAGTLVLDYGSGQDNSKIGNNILTLNGGNLVLRGGSHAQAVTTINFYSNTYSSITREAGSTATLANTGVIQANGAGNTSSTLSISAGGIVTTTTGNAGGGILANGKITIGSDFATNISNVIQSYSGYTTIAAGGAGDIAVTNLLTGGGAAAGSMSSYALKILSNADDNILTLGSGRDLIISNAATLLYAGGVGTNGNYTIDGSATSEVRTSSNSSFHINVASGTLTVNTTLGNTGDTILVKTGAGTLVVGGAYVGSNNSPPVVIQQGVLRVANSAGLGSTNGATSVQIGAALELSQTTGGSPADITIGAEALTINGTGISDGGALRNHSGSNTYGGLITIGGGGARINSNVSSTLALTGGITTASGNDVTFGGAGDTTVSTAAISGAGGLIKDGAGTTTLSAGVTHSYTGTTTVSGNGKLIVNGNISTSTLTTVQTGATLGGSGTVGKTTVLAGGILSPGNSPGTMTYTDTLGLAGNVLMEIDGNAGAGVTGGHDFINLTGTGAAGVLTYGGTMTLDIGMIFGVGTYSWNLFDFDSETGGFTGITLTDKYSGSLLDADLNGVWDLTSGDNTWVFTESTGVLGLTVAVIPEPKAALLGAIGLLLLLRRRRQD